MNVGLIGFGYFGKILFKNLIKHPLIYSIHICDISLENLKMVPNDRNNKKVIATQNLSVLLSSSDVDIIIIATPANTHYVITKACLEHHKHVFVEKPLSLSLDECEKLVNLAKQIDKVLHIDNSFIYDKNIIFLKSCLTYDLIGKPLFYRSTRSNLGPFSQDIDVVFDLGCHDISIINFLFPRFHPEYITCNGFNNLGNQVDSATITLFDNSFNATIYINWTSPRKTREIICGGTRGIYSHDYSMDQNPEITNYDGVKQKFKEITNLGETIYVELNHFLESVIQNKPTLSSGDDGSKIIKILELAEKSLKENGKPFKII